MSSSSPFSSSFEFAPISLGAKFISGYAFKSSDFSDHGIPVIKIKNIQDGIVTVGSSQCVPASLITEKLKKFETKNGDVLIAMTGQGSVGRVGRVSCKKEQRLMLNQRVGRFVADEKTLNLDYLYYVISSKPYKQFLFDRGAGSGQPNLSPDSILSVEIPFPSYKQQVEISTILNGLDERIALLRETNATLEATAQALFKSWFVDFDPVHANAGTQAPSLPAEIQALFPSRLVESPQGLIPEGWEQLPLYDIAEYINGAAYKAFEPNLDKLGLPIIKIAELKAGVTSQTAYSNVAMKEKYRIDDQDILFSWSGNPDTSIDTFVWSDGAAWLNQHIFKVVPHRKLDRPFILMLLKFMKPVFAEIARDKQTTGLGHVTVADLKRLVIVKPIDTVLESWNSVVEPIVEQSFTCIKQIQTLANLRDTLLPRLISGQLRLPDTEAALAEVS